MGRFHSVNQRYAEAAAILKIAAEVNAKSFIVRTVLARAYLGAGAHDDAFRTYEEAAVLASAADRKALAGQFGFTGVGDGYMTAGRARDALRAYQKALELDPANAELPAKIAAMVPNAIKASRITRISPVQRLSAKRGVTRQGSVARRPDKDNIRPCGNAAPCA